jgi:hypothetical protein
MGALIWVAQGANVRGQEAGAPENGEAPGLADMTADEAREKAQQVAAELEEKGRAILEASRRAEPLRLPGLPGWVGALFRDFNPAVAGLLLLFSSFFRGWKMSLLVLPAAAIALVGDRLGVPGAGPLDARGVCLVVAVGLTGLGILFGRTRGG